MTTGMESSKALTPTLDGFVERDPRVLRVYRRARDGYNRHALPHHNFLHILRDLSRALVIAETEPSVDYGILIPAVLLHDIGFFVPEYKTLGHDVTGAQLAREWLLELGGYDEAQSEAICHCVRAHKAKAEMPRSLEAQILYDADVLEKAGLVYLMFGGKVSCEFNEPIEHFLTRENVDRAKEVKRGFFTARARELDNGRLERTLRLLAELDTEIRTERSDVLLDESSLWAGRAPE